jgi:DNA recombination protein RmuC
MTTPLLYLGFLLIGLILTHIYHFSTNKKIDAERLLALAVLNKNIEDAKKERDYNKVELTKAQIQNAQLQTRLEGQEASIIDQKNSLKNEFKLIAGEILETSGKHLKEVNQNEMKNILDPLKLQLKEFKEQVDTTYDKESKQRFALEAKIKDLVDASGKVGQQADNLVNALKSNVKQQGNWGEMLLESILEHSGLTKNREYFTQEYIRDNAGNVIKDDEGKALQPDVTIHYPDQRKVIIDSKVSMIAWEQFVNEPDADKQKQYLDLHVKSMKQHVEGLSKKNYAKYAKALDYVLMFVPIEPAFLEGVKQDTGLWKYAYDRQVLIVAPTNLLAVLRIIADLWKIEQQSKNAVEIADKAGALYDKVHGFITSMEGIEDGLNKARTSYDNAFKQLSTGKGNIIGRVEELKRMGAKANKSLPDKYLNEDE